MEIMDFMEDLFDQVNQTGMSYILGGADCQPLDVKNNGETCEAINGAIRCDVINGGTKCLLINQDGNCKLTNLVQGCSN